MKRECFPASWAIILFIFLSLSVSYGQNKHSPASRYPEYDGLVMCGYQGWFRAPEDGANEGWGHYAARGQFDSSHVHLDFWPDVSEYAKTYPTSLTNSDGSTARVFSSVDQATTDLHFSWMREYGIDGVFVQRFYGGLRTKQSRRHSRVVLEHALISSQKYGRALAVMYDLSGLGAEGEDCSPIIQDWKELVDELNITSQPANNYLYHRGKPVVAIWGLGFTDRPYNLHAIGIEKLIDFLKNDPHYGGCAIMLGVPTYFRELDRDCVPDPYLHELMARADIIMPWMVGRFTPLQRDYLEQYHAKVEADIAWCKERQLDYVPCIYPGFSWYNLAKVESHGDAPLNQIPREKGAFYWSEISDAIQSGSRMFYVAMFDEMDEGTAIFKCSNHPPVGPKLSNFEGLPTDHYLWLTGEAGKMLRGEIQFSKQIPNRQMAKSN